MKIHMTIKGLGLGGAERHVADSAIELKRRGHDVSVSYLLPHKDALVPEIASDGIRVDCIGRAGIGGSLSSLFRLASLLRELHPDVVHAHLPVAGMIARCAKLTGKFRLVYTEHNLFRRLHPVTKIAHRLTRYIDDCPVSCSQQVADSLPWSSTVVRNGISLTQVRSSGSGSCGLRSSLGLPANDTVYVCIANLLKKKNHGLMLEAFSQAFGGAGGAQLVLIGQDGTERENLEDMCGELGIGANVHFHGPHSNAAQLLAGADVFCLSSSFEGLPIALLESMAAGIPAIVTDVGGMPDAVVDQVSGRVVESGSKDQMAHAMRQLHEQPDLRRSMGIAAAARVASVYSLKAMVDELIACYSGERGRP